MKQSNKHHLTSILYLFGIIAFALFMTFSIYFFTEHTTFLGVSMLIMALITLIPNRKFFRHFKESTHKSLWVIVCGVLTLFSAVIIFAPKSSDNVETSDGNTSSIEALERVLVVDDENSSISDTTTASTTEVTTPTPTLTTTTTATPTTTTTTTPTTTTTTATTTTSQTTTTTATTTVETTTTEIKTTTEYIPEVQTVHFILNTDTNCVHLKDTCNAAKQILPENYVEVDIPENEIIYYKNEYWACGICAKKYKDQLPKFEDWQ